MNSRAGSISGADQTRLRLWDQREEEGGSANYSDKQARQETEGLNSR